MADGFHGRHDIVRGATAAAVRLHDELDPALLRVRRRIVHHFVVVPVLFRLVDAEREQVCQRERLGILDLLPRFLDRILQRNVVPRAQRSHVGLQSAAGDALFQCGQVFRRRLRPDERLVPGPGEQAHGLVTRRFDLLQRVVKAPCRPRAIETPDRPLDIPGTERG